MLKNCTESTECSLPWWPVSSLGEIPRGHLSDGIHTHALVTNSEQGLDKLTNPHSFEKMIESVRCEMYHALAFGSYSAALTGYFLVVTRRMPLFVQPKVMSWNWKFSNSGPAALNLLRTEDGDNSDDSHIGPNVWAGIELRQSDKSMCHVKSSDPEHFFQKSGRRDRG